MECPPLIYQSLDRARRSIRVLELLPGVSKSDLRGILRTVALDDKPSYEALSYTWGSQNEGRSLKIRQSSRLMSKSSTLPVTDNLFRALKRLRWLSKTRVLWVDAVCINQQDDDERSAQVALMADIYSNAASTVIWLGDVNDTDIHNVDLSAGQRSLKLAASFLPLDILWNSDCFPMDQALQTTTPKWQDRGWIIQEYALSRRPYFQFGSRTRMIDEASPYGGQMGGAIPDSGFILEKVVQFPGLGSLTTRLKKLDEIKVEIERGRTMSLYHAALASGASTTSDPRDKVYSLLSFLNPIERDLVSPDYRVSAEVAFSQATYAAFKGPTQFAMLELIKFNMSGTANTLPTWAYDFRTLDPFSRHIDRLSGETTVPSLEVNVEGTEIKLEGACVDVVVGTTPPLPGFWEECSEHSEHDIETQACIVADFAREVIALIKLTAGAVRQGIASRVSSCNGDLDKPDVGNHREFLVNHVFPKGRRVTQESVIYKLLENWEAIASSVGILRANNRTPASQVPSTDQTPRANSSRPMHDQTRYYCKEVSDAAVLFTTMSGNLGVAPSTIRRGDNLVLPLYETATGKVDAAIVPFAQPLTLILRQRVDDKWTFHGLAHLDGFGDKAQYMRNVQYYTIQ